jgi:hypothetical protein
MTFGHDVFGAGERTGHADPNLIWDWFPTGDGAGGSWHVTGYTPCDPLDPACVSHPLTHDNGGNGNGNGNGNGGSTPQEQDTGGQQSNGWEDEEEEEEEQHEEHPPHHGGGDSASTDTVSAAESWYATPEGRAPIIKAVMGTALVIWGATALVDMYQGRWM